MSNTRPADDDRDFADAVIDLYTRILRDIPEEPGTKIPDDVAAVAFPLATLGGALDLLSERLVEKPEPGKVKRSAYIPALNLFDALVTGAAHPFWRYAAIMQKSIHHRRPPTKVEAARRTIAVGLLRALMRESARDRRATQAPWRAPMTIDVAFYGVVTRDPERKTSAAGRQYLRLNVRAGNGDAVTWANVMIFADVDALAGRLVKESKVYVEGTATVDAWIDKEGKARPSVSVMCWRCVETHEIGRARPPRERKPRSMGTSKSTRSNTFYNDEIPF
jgi:single-stranded DNA-binding protein